MALVVTSFIGYGIGLLCGWMMKKTDNMFSTTTKNNRRKAYSESEQTFRYGFGDGGSDTL